MNHAGDEPEADDALPDDAADEANWRAQAEQRLQHVFHLAGDDQPARQLRQMVVEYRWGQRP